MLFVMIEPNGVGSSVIMSLFLVLGVVLTKDVVVILGLEHEAVLVLPDGHDVSIGHLH